MPRTIQQATIITEVTMAVHDCPTCGVEYAITEEFEVRRREDGRTFYCPNGHTLSYNGTRQQLERELEEQRSRCQRLKQQVDQVENDLLDEVKQRQAKEKELKRVEKRIHAGVCPFCRRNFANVSAHMQRKHPNE